MPGGPWFLRNLALRRHHPICLDFFISAMLFCGARGTRDKRGGKRAKGRGEHDAADLATGSGLGGANDTTTAGVRKLSASSNSEAVDLGALFVGRATWSGSIIPRPRGDQRWRRRRSRRGLPGTGTMAKGLPWPLATEWPQRSMRRAAKNAAETWNRSNASIRHRFVRLPKSARRRQSEEQAT